MSDELAEARRLAHLKVMRRRRSRLTEAGFVQRSLWVHRDDLERFEDFKRRLTRPGPTSEGTPSTQG